MAYHYYQESGRPYGEDVVGVVTDAVGGSGAPTTTKVRAGDSAKAGRSAAAHGHNAAEPALQSVMAMGKAKPKPMPPNQKPPEGKGGKIHPLKPFAAGGGGQSGAAAASQEERTS